MQDFLKLRVVAQARVVLRLTYRVTGQFPSAEQFGVVAHMRRTAFNIGSNIAEGCGRSSYAAFRACLDRASGEGSELHYQCLAAQDLEFGVAEEVETLLEEVVKGRKMLSSFIVDVRARQAAGEHPDEGRPR